MKMFLNKGFIILLLMTLWSCKKDKTPSYEREMNDSIVINLKNTSVENNLDSIGFLEFKGNQNVTSVYDIATWRRKNKRRDSVLTLQLNEYFLASDTQSIPKLYHELDSLDVYFTKIANLKVLEKDSLESDSTGTLNYDVYYFNKDKQYFQKENKNIKYVLKKQPEKLKNQFTFYFYDLGVKDSTSLGVTQ